MVGKDGRKAWRRMKLPVAKTWHFVMLCLQVLCTFARIISKFEILDKICIGLTLAENSAFHM